jgi:hypothetical protein
MRSEFPPKQYSHQFQKRALRLRLGVKKGILNRCRENFGEMDSNTVKLRVKVTQQFTNRNGLAALNQVAVTRSFASVAEKDFRSEAGL